MLNLGHDKALCKMEECSQNMSNNLDIACVSPLSLGSPPGDW